MNVASDDMDGELSARDHNRANRCHGTATMKQVGEVYLGDGLYASFDGWQFYLRAPRADGDHWVGLDANVLAAFDEFRRTVLKKKEND